MEDGADVNDKAVKIFIKPCCCVLNERHSISLFSKLPLLPDTSNVTFEHPNIRIGGRKVHLQVITATKARTVISHVLLEFSSDIILNLPRRWI